jgi:hypothetical protein
MVKQRKGGKAAAAKAAATEKKKPEGDAEVDVDEVRPPPVTPLLPRATGARPPRTAAPLFAERPNRFVRRGPTLTLDAARRPDPTDCPPP